MQREWEASQQQQVCMQALASARRRRCDLERLQDKACQLVARQHQAAWSVTLPACQSDIRPDADSQAL